MTLFLSNEVFFASIRNLFQYVIYELECILINAGLDFIVERIEFRKLGNPFVRVESQVTVETKKLLHDFFS